MNEWPTGYGHDFLEGYRPIYLCVCFTTSATIANRKYLANFQRNILHRPCFRRKAEHVLRSESVYDSNFAPTPYGPPRPTGWHKLSRSHKFMIIVMKTWSSVNWCPTKLYCRIHLLHIQLWLLKGSEKLPVSAAQPVFVYCLQYLNFVTFPMHAGSDSYRTSSYFHFMIPHMIFAHVSEINV